MRPYLSQPQVEAPLAIAPRRPVLGVRKPAAATAVRTGKHSVTTQGVMGRPAWQLTLSRSQPKRSLISRVAVDQMTPGMPTAVWNAENLYYSVSSTFTPYTTPGLPITVEQPTLELATVAALDLEHTPLNCPVLNQYQCAMFRACRCKPIHGGRHPIWQEN